MYLNISKITYRLTRKNVNLFFFLYTKGFFWIGCRIGYKGGGDEVIYTLCCLFDKK